MLSRIAGLRRYGFADVSFVLMPTFYQMANRTCRNWFVSDPPIAISDRTTRNGAWGKQVYDFVNKFKLKGASRPAPAKRLQTRRQWLGLSLAQTDPHSLPQGAAALIERAAREMTSAKTG